MGATSIFNRIAFGGGKKKPTKERVWYYQHLGEDKNPLYKVGKYWMFTTPEARGGGQQGSDTLSGAKGDLLMYEGTKVWSELV